MTLKRLMATLLASAALTGSAMAVDLRIGLQEDPDVLDPDQSRTFVGRIVYTSLCDKLVDITPDLEYVPQLATEWSWSEDGRQLTMQLREGATFHDGTPFNAEAVVANIDRSQNLPESRRQSELASVTGVEATGEYEVVFTLEAPDATLLAQLSDRAGMMISPTAAEEAGLDFGNNPVCSGPYQFVERVQQDRIVLEKFADYWNADNYHFDRVTYLPIPDTTVRLANLQAGDLDMLERLAPSDAPAVQQDESLIYEDIVGLGYQGITVNIDNGPNGDNPFGNEAKLRQAFSLAIDRNAINEVVFQGTASPGNQHVPPSSPWYVQDFPVPERDVEAARALLEEAGVDRMAVEAQVPNNPVQQQMMQMVQAMVAEAGFDLSLKATEFASMLSAQTAGDYQLSQVGWSGRTDPDGNIHQFVTCEGGINDSKYCNEEVDRLLNAARETNEMEERKALYAEAQAILNEDLPIIYLYHPSWIWALDNTIEGFVAYPDGMIRLENVTMAE
ncbi:ABC transporter substrate-binding protein [Pararhizobium haloflavum]|uniref:ABC transporter substrate-binding protein n=1 Tax=Pararhizobium haloflavum TaxID=2037914 RepID=UPI000C1A59C6|nr:ABC transporter substrate-binding protein [Pararhizobium haloflavum]